MDERLENGFFDEIDSLVSKLDYKKSPLIPAVIQDDQSHEVLMLGFVDKEALKMSLQTGYMHYFSRTKNRIWKKGETSGHTQKIVKISLDCDCDSLLVSVIQEGGACHTGNRSCFFRDLTKISKIKSSYTSLAATNSADKILDSLFHTLIERKFGNPETSYVASLYQKGINTISKKITEEAGEVICELKDYENAGRTAEIAQKIVFESTDLFFHLLVALAYYNIHPERIFTELSRRFGMSGITEKAQRK